MAVDFVIAPEAERDVADAYGWYEDRQSGLGEDFLARIDACIRANLRSPKMHAKIHGDYRRGLVRRFPFAVFYDYETGTVTVYGIFHTSQDPEKWRRRLR